MDSMFGLGLVAPKDTKATAHMEDVDEDEDRVNILDLMHGTNYIRRKMVSIYLGVYDGTNKNPDVMQTQAELGLPMPKV